MKIVHKKSEYELQAEQFLQDTKTTFEAKLSGHGPYFEGDKDARDILRNHVDPPRDEAIYLSLWAIHRTQWAKP